MSGDFDQEPTGFAMPIPRPQKFSIEITLNYTDAARKIVKQSLFEMQFAHVVGAPLPNVGDGVRLGIGDMATTFRVVDRIFTYKAAGMEVNLILDV